MVCCELICDFVTFVTFYMKSNQKRENSKIRAQEDKKVGLKNNYLQIKTLRCLFPYVYSVYNEFELDMSVQEKHQNS